MKIATSNMRDASGGGSGRITVQRANNASRAGPSIMNDAPEKFSTAGRVRVFHAGFRFANITKFYGKLRFRNFPRLVHSGVTLFFIIPLLFIIFYRLGHFLFSLDTLKRVFYDCTRRPARHTGIHVR